MRSIFSNISALLAATFFVQASNAAITTMIGIVIAGSGGSSGDVALISSLYSAGFLAGCFVSPSQIQRLGFIRAFSAAAAILTLTIILLDMVDGIASWAFLRFSMGASMAAILAIADGWINIRTPNASRGRVIAIYAIVLGLASVLSQGVFLVIDADSENFVLIFAVAMNIAVVLVAITSAEAPVTQIKKRKSWRSMTTTSVTANVASFSSGFMTTSFVAIMPFYLTTSGVDDALVATAMIVTYMGRLLFQWPIGLMSDRLGRRTVLIVLCAGVGLLCIWTILFAPGEGALLKGQEGQFMLWAGFVGVFCLGGLMWPVYSVGSALAFDRADGDDLVDVSITLLVVNTIGAIAGPLLILGLADYLGVNTLPTVILVASALTMAVAFSRSSIVEEPAEPKAPAIPIPASSIEMAQMAAETVSDELEEIAEEIAEEVAEEVADEIADEIAEEEIAEAIANSDEIASDPVEKK
jgi:MFS family permease